MKPTIEYACSACGLIITLNRRGRVARHYNRNGIYCTGVEEQPQRVAVVPVYRTNERLPETLVDLQTDQGVCTWHPFLKMFSSQKLMTMLPKDKVK